MGGTAGLIVRFFSLPSKHPRKRGKRKELNNPKIQPQNTSVASMICCQNAYKHMSGSFPIPLVVDMG